MHSGDVGPPSNDNTDRQEALDRLTELLSAAYGVSKAVDEPLLTYLIAMALTEVGLITAEGMGC